MLQWNRLKRPSLWIVRILIPAILGGVFAMSLVSVKFPYLDALFLDFKGFVALNSLSIDDAVEVNLSPLKHGQSAIKAAELLSVIKELQDKKPRMILVAMIPAEIDGSQEEMESLSENLAKIPQLYLYSRWGKAEGDSFGTTLPFSKYTNHFSNKFTQDTKLGALDTRTRRLVLSMDGKGYDSDLNSFFEILNIEMPTMKALPGTFSLFGSEQVYLKYYSLDSMKSRALSVDKLDGVKDKIVFVGTSDAHSSLISQHPFGRFTLNETESDAFYFPDSRYLLTVYGNLKNLDYIKEPSLSLNWVWIAAMLSLNIWLLMVFQEKPLKALGYSFSLPVFAFLLNALIFKYLSWNFDFSRILIGNFLIQYLGVPFIFIKALRKSDELKVKEAQARDKELMKSRFILKTASADFNFKVAAKVSHDLRSPLMALQIASSFIKGKVSEDLESLIIDSTSRLKHIADETLNAYRSDAKSSKDLTPVQLKVLIEDLLKSYRFLYPNIDFVVEADPDEMAFISTYSLQRCLSNLLNNSIDAFSGTSIKGLISIIVKSEGDYFKIEISDNGPGISLEVRSKLFQEKATFGKVQGTGLGLFQVRQELEGYGGTATLLESKQGAKFCISLPKLLGKVPFTVAKNILVLEANDEIARALLNSNVEGACVYRAAKVQDAVNILAKSKSRDFTVLVDLTLDGEEENGFDLLEKTKDLPRYNTVLFSVLTENSDIQKIAADYGALLFEKGRISLLEFRILRTPSLDVPTQ